MTDNTMRTTSRHLVSLRNLISLLTLTVWVPWSVLGVPPLDHHAVFRTQVPHTKSSKGGGGGSHGGAGGGGGVPTATFSGSPYEVSSTVTPTTTVPEAEEHIAVNPKNPLNFVAAISDFALRGGYNTTKYAVLTESGWTQHYVPLSTSDPVTGYRYPVTSDGYAWDANSDPVVAIDNAGNYYLADLYFNANVNNSGNANGLYVTVCPNGGIPIDASTTYPVAVNPDPNPSIDEDKEWIAVDNSGFSFDGTVYVSWTRFEGNSDMILLSHSKDQGLTWSDPVQISPGTQNGAVQGSQVAVGPKGEVYVVYEVFFVGNVRQHWLAKSTDGGQTFSTAAAITPGFNELSFNSTYRKNSFASLSVNPDNGHVYVVYADQPSSSSQVEFIMSSDGGSTFSSPVAISDSSSGQRLMPAVTADNAGNIHASWFDTRNSGRSTASYDIYATYSADSGVTFGPNARVTSGSVYAGSASFIGDYGGIAAVGGVAQPVWTSGGFNGGRLQTAILTIPSSSPPPPLGGEVAVTGITPETLNAGSSESVTITGSGFQGGASVTFENGKGPAPAASVDSVSADGLTIIATASASQRAKRGSVWDVRVTNPDGGTAVLPGALTIN